MTGGLGSENFFSQFTFFQISEALFKASIQLNFPIAIWKLPENEQWEIMIGSIESINSETLIEDLPEGFIFNGFENKGIEGCFFLKSSVRYCIGKDLSHAELAVLGKEFGDTFLKILLNKDFVTFNKTSLSIIPNEHQEDEKKYFKEITERAIEEINKGKFQKVILSRIKKVKLEDNFDSISLFVKLSSVYKNAFTSLTFTPETGIWIGASPEILISVKDDIFRTCALAGTQQYQESIPLKQVPWTQKEIEEQAFVCRYIISCFKRIRLRDYVEEGPKTVRAANLTHLRSDFSVDLKAVDYPHLASDMLDLLHPTSAVCGMPHKPAFDFIFSNERFKRELYAGYLGPVNIDNSIHLFVNLRCMKIENNIACLFAGVGITEDSLWEKEWHETEIKFRTLLNVLDFK